MHKTMFRRTLMAVLAVSAVCLTSGAALAQEALIRKNIAERLPDFPKIDEITKSPIPGLSLIHI